MPIPLAFQLALLTDLALKITAALMGIEHGLLVASPIAESGLLVLAAAVLHEAVRMLGEAVQRLRRSWGCRRWAPPPRGSRWQNSLSFPICATMGS
jgi:hypothetical protein